MKTEVNIKKRYTTPLCFLLETEYNESLMNNISFIEVEKDNDEEEWNGDFSSKQGFFDSDDFNFGYNGFESSWDDI